LRSDGAGGPDAFEQSTLFSYEGVWSAGHSVSGVREITDVATLIRHTRDELRTAVGRPGVSPPVSGGRIGDVP
jgi:hypothetical protein